MSTPYAPPRESAEPDDEMIARLGLAKDALPKVARRVVAPERTGAAADPRPSP